MPDGEGGTILEVRDLVKSFGGLHAIDRCSFAVREGTITGLIGPNGAGKTTAFNVITGMNAPTSGEVRYRGERITGLARHQMPEHDAITAQEGTRDVLDRLGVVRGRRPGRSRPTRLAAGERPPTGVFDTEQRGAPGSLPAARRTAPVGGHEQRAQADEAVRVDEAVRDQFAERIFDLRAQQPASVGYFVEERRAVRREEVEDCARRGTERRCVLVLRKRRPDAQMTARGKHDRRRTHGARRPRATCLQRGYARPDHPAGAAQLVEPARVVLVHPCRQDLCLPGRGRRLEAFELRHDARYRIGALDPCLRGDALPLEQEAHEIACFHRFDLAPQPVHRVAMDAREQAALAPLGLRRLRREAPANHRALGFELQKYGLH
ncbi:MAG: ATP-binding cassette domain-containing protein, partial [Gammaproteobacteria bacterium]